MAKAKPQITTTTAVTYEVDLDPRGGILDFENRGHSDGDQPWVFILQKVTTTTSRDGRGERYDDRTVERETIDVLNADQVAKLVKTAVEKLTWPINTANRNLAHDQATNPAMVAAAPSREYTADIDTVVSLGPKGEKSASQLKTGDVFKDFGDSDDEWKRVVADDTGEGDTVIIRVIDAPDPDAPEEDPAVAAANTLSNAALVEAADEAKALNGVEQTWTFFGHWDDDRIVVEWFEPGTVEDDRDDDGEHEQGLWAASASGPDSVTAQAAAVAEYEEADE